MFQSKPFGILTRSFLLPLLAATQVATAATNTVTTAADDNSSGTLRRVISNSVSGDTIIFASNLSGQTILLTGGQITISNSLTLDASTLPARLTIDGNKNGRIFVVTNNATVVLDSLSITNGSDSGPGGGIHNSGILTLNRCTVSGSSSSAGGGGIYNAGMLTLTKSTVANNVASTSGGGIYNDGSLTVSQSTLSGNSSSDYGGGLAAYSPAFLYQCTLARNSSGLFGGGIYDRSFVLLSQSTVSSNTASLGGGGICDEFNASLTLFNSIVAGNTGPDIVQFVAAILFPITYSGVNLTSGNPMLAPLGNYGGPTQTMPPLLGSPAIDNASDTATNTYSVDQRDLPRLVGLHADIGAVELAFAPGAPMVVTQPATSIDTNVATLNATVTQNGAVTTAYFQFGTTTSYGTNIALPALTNGSASVSASLTGLVPATTYHFRIVASNSLGTTFGNDLSFSTRNPIHVVNNTNDSGPGSLRDALANFFAGDTVILSSNLSGQTILLTSGQLALNNSMTLDASTLPGGLTINGNANDRVFQITGGTVQFNSLTITNGKTSGSGGGIDNGGTLTLTKCSVVGNSAVLNGGGINGGSVVLNQSTVAGNSAGNNGGGINGHATLNQSTVAGNSASTGGGIYDINPQISIYQSTVSANSATNVGGGMYIDVSFGGYLRLLSLSNSIVAGNTSPSHPDLRYDDNPVSYSPEFLGANLTNGNPQLSPLGNYGGPTLTMPPLVDSPAIDGCSNGTSFATDQRGFPRLSGLYADIGAVESSFAPAIPLAVTQPAVVLGSNSATLNAYFAPHGAASTCYLQYGTSTNYSDSTPPIVLTSGASRSVTVTGLLPMTIYHFRAVATNNLGRSNGDDLTFQTGGFPNRVSNTNDNGSGSLRDAVENFNNGSSITFDPALAGKTIVLTSGPVILAKSLSIDASALSASIAIDGNQNGRIFSVTNNTNIVVVLDSLIIKNGKVLGDSGGGIYSGGNLTLNRCTVAGNDTSMNGGGIYNGGRLTLNSSTVAGNTASTNGGGIFNQGLLVLNASTVCSNSSAFSGGGLYNLGGIAFSTFNQSTFSGNSANTGGGLFLAFGLLMDQCTISANYATNGGGGLYNTNNSLPRITNSIFTGNFGPVSPDILWLGSTAVLAQWSANLTNGNPMLAPLGNYGGPTLTMPPLSGSPAIDGCTGGTHFATDQRGFPRLIDGNGDSIAVADIGAVEGVPYPDGPGTLSGIKKLGNGNIQFGFPNYTGKSYTVFATTNLAAPLNTWMNLGPAVETPAGSGQYQFTDPGATNAQRFYRVRSP